MTRLIAAPEARVSGFAPVGCESVIHMACVCSLAGIDREKIQMFGPVLRPAGEPALATIARFDVTELGKLAPDLRVCDIDDVEVDSLKLLRRLRFVLPECLIAAYTGRLKRTWGLAGQLAGANYVLSEDADEAGLSQGVCGAIASSCYTDPKFAPA